MKNLSILILSIFLLYFFCGCRDDAKEVIFSDAEKRYLEDYKRPVFKWGYIDKSGNEVIKAIYDDTRDFKDGRAAVNYKGYWGYIDRQGTYIVQPRYRMANNYSEQIAIATTFDGTFDLLDIDGNIIKKLNYSEVFSVSHNRLRVRDSLGYTFINLSGNKITDAFFDNATDFTDGYAIVSTAGKYGIIDTGGLINLPLEYNMITYVGSQIFSLTKNERNSYYTPDGRFTLPSDIENLLVSGESRAYTIEDQIWIIQTNGEAYRTGFDVLLTGGEGKWFYQKDIKMGVLDDMGNKLTEPVFDVIYRFKEDRAAYLQGNAWGYLMENGDQLTPPVYPLVWDFQDNMARIISRGGIGFIDKSGSLAISPVFIEVRDFYEGLARFQKYR